MHAGFTALREECGMNFWRPPAKRALSAGAQANIARVQEIWTNARATYGAGGPFLFGKFTAAGAMYAPIVQRFAAYDTNVNPRVKAHIERMPGLPGGQSVC